jgi:HSP20 family protein
MKCYIVEANVPGLSAEDLDIAVSESALTIGGYCEEKCHDGDSFIHRECGDGSFCRTVALPDNADTERAKAELDRNVLTIHVPKKSESAKKARKLEIVAALPVQKSSANDKKKAA